MDVDSIALAGTWFRQIPAGGDPLYQPVDPADYRWQRGTVVDALYLAESGATAWAGVVPRARRGRAAATAGRCRERSGVGESTFRALPT